MFRVRIVPSWARAISVPTALLGIVAFFLPWFQFSCRSLSLSSSVSGYELATGTWQQRLDSKRADEFWSRLESSRPTRKLTTKRREQPATSPPQKAETVPFLWAVPAACLLLAVLGVFGLPRVATTVVSAVASAYLAYFGVSIENQASDPRITGGILGHDWLPAFWATWAALLVPVVFSYVRLESNDSEHGAEGTDDSVGHLSLR